MNNTWNELANDVVIKNTIESLKKNGINAELVKTRDEAKKKVLSLIPEGAEVMAMTSVSLDTINIPEEIKSGNYNSVREKLYSMDRETHGRETQKLGAAPEYAIGSVNAVTEDGKVIIASNTGSQLSAYAYGSSKVVWVVGTQKIVKNIEEGMKRIYEHSLPLESERAKKAYEVPGSSVNKILIVNKEIQQNRIHIIFVNEQLGF